MTTALMESTQIQFNLTINVNINADRTLLLLFTLFTFVAWKIKLWTLELALFWGDFKEALRFTTKVYIIGLRSLAYGMGVRV